MILAPQAGKVGPLISDQERSALLEAAREAAVRAYCPYSNFRVGAAILTDHGEIFSGCNVENASYGLTICAERNAVFQAVARLDRPLRIRAVLVYTPTALPTAPCGGCRQVLSEFGPDGDVFCQCDGPHVIRTTLGALLPHAFGPDELNREHATCVHNPSTSP
jgi:cytidine deaminase